MPGQRRIAIVAAGPEVVGGHSVQAQALVDALRRDGVDAWLVPIHAPFPRGLRWVRRVPFLRTVLNQLLYVPGLRRLAESDVVHVFSASYVSFLLAPVPAMIAGRLLGKRVVLHYHSGEADDHLARWGVLVHPWLRLADEIVVPSEYLARVFARHGHAATVVPNIIDLQRFRYADRNPVGPRLLSARNLERLYRVDVILEAFRLVKARYPQARLTIAGDGSQAAALRALAGEGVTFVGAVSRDDVPRLFEEADILLNASEIDNQPVTILEAFAAGVPVITTPPGDIPAMVVHERTGLIVPFDNPFAIEAAVSRLMAHRGLAASLARSARETLRAYTWESVRSAWQRVYGGDAGTTTFPSPTAQPCTVPNRTH